MIKQIGQIKVRCDDAVTGFFRAFANGVLKLVRDLTVLGREKYMRYVNVTKRERITDREPIALAIHSIAGLAPRCHSVL